MTLDISQRIDLQALSTLDDNHYLYAQQKGSTQIQTSAQPIKGSFLFFSIGTSEKHRHGFEQLKAQVRRQYGFELQADHARTGKITVGSLKRQIADAQLRNVDVYDALLRDVHRTYQERQDDAFVYDQTHLFEQVRNDYGAGHVLTAARKKRRFDAALARAQAGGRLPRGQVLAVLDTDLGAGRYGWLAKDGPWDQAGWREDAMAAFAALMELEELAGNPASAAAGREASE
jgi:hypothetical protein